MSVPRYGAAWPGYARLWDKAVVRPSRVAEATSVAKHLLANKARYVALEKKTHVPWWVIAGLHERESSARFDRQLAQGDPLNRRAVNEPHSGPFPSFEASAVWALHHDHLDTVIDWRIEKCIWWGTAWNGWGYELHHIPSPFAWGATSVQKHGKYIRDHVYSSSELDTQLGLVAIWKKLAELDKSIKFVRETPPGVSGDEGSPVEPPLPTNQVDTSELVKKDPTFLPSPSPLPPLPLPQAKGGFWNWLTKTRQP